MYSDLGPHGSELFDQSEGRLATEAYLCMGGAWTLGRGATEWPDGRAIGPHDVCTEEQASALTDWSLSKFAAIVDDTVKVPTTRNQRAALIISGYNIGPDALRKSSIVARLNNGESPLRVADAFGMWCKATNSVPEKYDLNDAHYQPIIGKNAKGRPCWVGPAVNPPDGFEVVREGDEFWGVSPKDPTQRVPLGLKPCSYQRAIPALLRRHLSAACFFLDLDWRQACRKDTVSITSDRIWDNKDKRWEDLVRKKTELADVLSMARLHPLTNPGGKPAIAIAGPTEPVHESPQLSAGEGRAAQETAPAGATDSNSDILFDRAASEADPEAKDKGGGAGLPASQPEVPAPLPQSQSQPKQPPSAPSIGAEAAGAVPPTQAPAASSSPAGEPQARGSGAPVSPRPGDSSTVVAGRDGTKPPKRPAPPPPPSVQVSNMGWEGLKDMMTSKRFYGGVLIVFGRVVIAMNLGGLAAPGVVGALIGDGILMDWTTGIIANMAGEVVKHWGEKDAKSPLGTAKEVALATDPKASA